ncbi:MAG: hypothetical protein L0Z47_07430 [Actinobacteria bacterium]|nr:hypothetical protein [Actinomycetota bacterium]
MRILPRTFSQVLNDALTSLARIWKPLVSTSVLVFLPAGVITVTVFAMTGASEFLRVVFDDPGYLETLPRDVFLDLARPFLVAALIGLVVQGLVTLYVYLCCHRIAIVDIQGGSPDAPQARREALRRIPKTFVAGLLAALLVAALILAAIMVWTLPLATVGTPNATSLLIAPVLLAALLVPGVWLAVSFSMLTPVMAVESRGIFAALERSRALVRRRWWPTFGFLVLVGLLGSVATQLIQLVAVPLATVGGVEPGLLLVSLLGLAAQGPIVAAMGASYTHWYVDLRSRVESLMRDQL